jgi:D-lactate dehydrogenase
MQQGEGHCNAMRGRRNVISARVSMWHARISKMKPGAVLINVSRGGLVDTDALIEGLESGQVGGVGMDVYESEGGLFFKDYTQYSQPERLKFWDRRFKLLLTYPNVIITPHSAFLTEQALTNITNTTIDNLREFALGQELTYAVKLITK